MPDPAANPKLERGTGVFLSPTLARVTPVCECKPRRLRKCVFRRVSIESRGVRLAGQHDLTGFRQMANESGQVREPPIRSFAPLLDGVERGLEFRDDLAIKDDCGPRREAHRDLELVEPISEFSDLMIQSLTSLDQGGENRVEVKTAQASRLALNPLNEHLIEAFVNDHLTARVVDRPEPTQESEHVAAGVSQCPAGEEVLFEPREVSDTNFCGLPGEGLGIDAPATAVRDRRGHAQAPGA